MSATLELQGAIVPLLKAGVEAAGGRVFDRVPSDAAFPYLSLGYWQETPDDADCIEGAEIFGRVDCWSRAVGKAEALRLADAVRAALNDAAITLTDNALVLIEWIRTDVLSDPDGLTTHAIVEIRALVERP
jgi:hypothetical protein